MLVVVKKSARADNLIYFGQCLVSLLSGHNTDGFFLREWRYRNDKR